MNQSNEQPFTTELAQTVELPSRKSQPSRLTEPQVLVVRIIFALLMIGSLISFSIAFVNMSGFLRTGFTGAMCFECDYAAGKFKIGVVPGSPADRAGIANGDTLLAIDGKPPSNFPFLRAIPPLH